VKRPTPPPPLPENGVPDGKGKAVEPTEEQLLQMNNERFTVPEVLFNPSTIGACLEETDRGVP
jgi:actin-related protein 6